MSKPTHVFVLTLFAFATPFAPTAAQQPAPGGRYAIRVCRPACQEGPYVTGSLLLLADTLRDRTGAAMGSGLLEGPADGCFTLQVHHQLDDSYAGIAERGTLAWHYPTSDTLIHFALYRSPDAGYEVELRPIGRRLVGTGHSWGAGVVEIHAPTDSIEAVWEGTAIPADCNRILDR